MTPGQGSRPLAGSRPCLARLSPIPSSSSPWVLPGALLTAFWPNPPPHPWPAAAPASLYMYKLPINRTAAIMLNVVIAAVVIINNVVSPVMIVNKWNVARKVAL